MNEYSDLPYFILLTLRRGLRDDVETAQKMQIFFANENDHGLVAVWSSNERFFQEHLDLVEAVINH